MARIAVGGFQHETNTFSPSKATYRDFEVADGWPGLTRGQEILEVFRNMNLPLAGFIDRAKHRGHEVVPTLWCSAAPSGPVEEEAYERIARELLQRIEAAAPFDAIYLDLHGAMVTEHLEDGEGELLARLRGIVGDRMPIVSSLDLHANVTERMVAHASALVVCRTYPHVDLWESGEWAAGLLERLMARGPFGKAMRRGDFLVPLPWQCTLIDPAASLYRTVAEAESLGPGSTSFAFGFPLADIAECGPTMLAYAQTQSQAEATADRLISALSDAERQFAGKIWSAEEAVGYARAKAKSGGKLIILADAQDNPGAGGHSDTVGLLKVLVAAGVEGAVVANMCDPEAALAAHQAGIGARVELSLGSRSGGAEQQPYTGTFSVEALGDGKFTATGPFYRGNRMQLGPMALLRVGGVKIVVTSRKQQAADQAMLRHVGIEPREQKILALKSSVHFRADFQDLADEVLIVASPGVSPLDHRKLPYKHLRHGLRVMPMDESGRL